MPDINPILAAAQKTQQASVQAEAALADNYVTRSALEEAQAQLQTDIGTQNQIITGAADSANLSAQQARIKVGNAFGINASDQGEIITKATARYHQADQVMNEALDEINRKQQTSFFDNPIEYLSNIFTVNSDIDKYNTAAVKRDDALQYIEGANRAGDAVAKTQDQFKETITVGAIAANQKKIADTAALSANEALIKARAYNADAVTMAYNMSKDRLNIDFNVNQAKNQNAQLNLALANYQMHKEEWDWKKAAKEEQEYSDEQIAARLQKGFEVLYGANAPDLTGNPKLAKHFVALLKSNTPAGKEATEAYLAGQSGVVAGKPSGTIDVIKSGIPVSFTPAQQPIKQLFDTIFTDAQGTQAYQMAIAAKDKAKAQAVIDDVSKQHVDNMLREIVPGDGRNVFNIGSLGNFMQAPSVKGDPVVTQILAPAIAAGARMDDPSQVFSTVIQGVKEGKINLIDAAMGLSSVYQVAVKTNLAAKNLSKFGVVSEKIPMNTYNSRVQTNPSALMGGSEVINFTDPNSVLRAMNKSMAASATTELRTSIPPVMQ